MSYTLIREPHQCGPFSMGVNHGTVVRCDCGRYWRFISPPNPDYAGWRRLGWFGRWIWT